MSSLHYLQQQQKHKRIFTTIGNKMVLSQSLLQDIQKLRDKNEKIERNDYTRDILDYTWKTWKSPIKSQLVLYKTYRGPLKGLTLNIYTQTESMPLEKWCQKMTLQTN